MNIIAFSAIILVIYLVPKPRLGNALAEKPQLLENTTRSKGFECRYIPKLGLGNEETRKVQKIASLYFCTPD
jgi:hypothetical protein